MEVPSPPIPDFPLLRQAKSITNITCRMYHLSSRVVAAGSLDLITCVMVIVGHVRLHHDGVHLVVLAAHDDDVLLPVIAASHLLLLLVALGRVETRLIQHVIVERG